MIGLSYGGDSEGGEGQVKKEQEEQIIAPIVDAFAEFRDKVRTFAKAKEIGKVLDACDVVRDDTLPNLGIRLEDRAAGQVT